MPVRFRKMPGETYVATMMMNGMAGALAQGMLDMAVQRTPESTAPSSFRQ